jgi:hypothetical protein
MSMKEFADFRAFLRGKEYFLKNAETVTKQFDAGLCDLFIAFASCIPKTADPSPFAIPFVYAIPEPGELMRSIYSHVQDPKFQEKGLFYKLTWQLYVNICNASEIEPFTHAKKPYRHANTSELPLDALTDTYLGGTPLHKLFYTPVPLKLTHEERFNHMHIVGGSGSGKTTLLENLILHDLTMPDSPSLIIVDPHGDLIHKITHADLGIEDRLVIISPKDIHHPPALNIFDVKRSRLDQYDDVMKEQVIAGVIQTFDYLFSGLLGADLTAKQGVFFKYIARLMLSLPETMGRSATILDMMELMKNPAPYRGAIEALPPLQRAFFGHDFNLPTFTQTKEQIRYRLQAIIENPTIAKLFTMPETKIDLFTEMNRGAVILVDAAKDFLKDASSHFGRIFISLVLQAVLERAAIPAKDRKDAFLIVDEAATFFDSNIDELLTDARKYRCGCVFAHQYLDQCTGALRASLAANTGAKFASGVSHADARSMAPEMRTTPKFIQSQPRLQFACHIRNITPQAVSIPVEAGKLDGRRKLSEEAYHELIERNRERVCQPPPGPMKLIAPKPPEDIDHDPSAASETW